MASVNIPLLVGSLLGDSLNRHLGNALANLEPTDFNFSQFEIDDLPLYNQGGDGRQAAQEL